MDQVTLSKMLGVAQAQISRYERGHDVPELKPLLKLLCLAKKRSERRPIFQELRRRGIDDVISSLRQSGFISQSSVPAAVSGEEAPGAKFDSDLPVYSPTPEELRS
jgi:hypothetical protein